MSWQPAGKVTRITVLSHTVITSPPRRGTEHKRDHFAAGPDHEPADPLPRQLHARPRRRGLRTPRGRIDDLDNCSISELTNHPTTSVSSARPPSRIGAGGSGHVGPSDYNRTAVRSTCSLFGSRVVGLGLRRSDAVTVTVGSQAVLQGTLGQAASTGLVPRTWPQVTPPVTPCDRTAIRPSSGTPPRLPAHEPGQDQSPADAQAASAVP
jgi:hypothetical protein